MSSTISAPAAEVWARVTSPEGINEELRPWLRMTVPAPLRDAGIDNVPIGEPLGRSWILLFGFLPVDYDDLRLAELEPGRRFLERSTMFSMRVWAHERTVDPAGDRTSRVSDRLGFELRRPLALLPGGRTFARGIIGAIFRRRHRRLAAHFSRSDS